MPPFRRRSIHLTTGPVFWDPNNPNHRDVRPGSLGILETRDRNGKYPMYSRAKLTPKVADNAVSAPFNPPTERLVEVRDAGRMGLGLFAKESIPRGARILAEHPLFAMPAETPFYKDDSDNEDVIVTQRDSDNEDVIVARRDVKDIGDFVDHIARKGLDSAEILAMEGLYCDEAPARDKVIRCVINRHILEETSPKWTWDVAEFTKHFGVADERDTAWEVFKDRAVDRYTRLYAIWNSNRIDLGAGATMGCAVFLLTSRLNHSCCPNVWSDFNPHVGHSTQPPVEMVTTHAMRDIAAGEQLLVAYSAMSLEPREERAEKLALWGVYDCGCALCTDPLVETLQQRADMLWQAVEHWVRPWVASGDDLVQQGIALCKDGFEALKMGEEVIALLTHPMWNVREIALADAYKYCSIICEELATDPKVGLPYEEAVQYWQQAMRFCGEKCQTYLILSGPDGREMKKADIRLERLRDRREEWKALQNGWPWPPR